MSNAPATHLSTCLPRLYIFCAVGLQACGQASDGRQRWQPRAAPQVNAGAAGAALHGACCPQARWPCHGGRVATGAPVPCPPASLRPLLPASLPLPLIIKASLLLSSPASCCSYFDLSVYHHGADVTDHLAGAYALSLASFLKAQVRGCARHKLHACPVACPCAAAARGMQAAPRRPGP